MKRLLLALCVAPLAGCFPFALPPLELSGGGGVTMKTGATNPKVPLGTTSMARAEAQLRPLAAVGELYDRPVDFGLGFAVENTPDVARYGPSAELRWFPFIDKGRDNGKGTSLGRLGAGLEARVLRDSLGHWGPVAALHLSGDLAGFVRGDCGGAGGNRSLLLGCFYGEAALGGLIESSVGVYAGQRIWTLTANLTLRTPAGFGVLFFIPK
jgi:hypothetical protein